MAQASHSSRVLQWGVLAAALGCCLAAAAQTPTAPPPLAPPPAVVESRRFRTAATAPAFVVPPALRREDAWLRAAMQTMPEAAFLPGALLVGGGSLGLGVEQQRALYGLMLDVYNRLYADPLFRDLPSALPYCLATEKQTEGHYFLYHPRDPPTEPPAIVFLHGSSGNCQFYLWVLKEAFPDHVILAPSWGLSWGAGEPGYVTDMLTDASRRLERPLTRPWLMAISAGGPGGFRTYNEAPARYRGYVCLASMAQAELLPRLRPEQRLLIVNGTQDAGFPIAAVRQQVATMRQRVRAVELRELESDHFFFLSQRAEMCRVIKAWMATGQEERR